MSDILQQLQAATNGLLYPSESDYPIVPFEWSAETPPTTPAAFLAGKGYTVDTPVQQFDFAEFFARKTEIRDDQDEGQKATARRIAALVQTLQSTLHDLRVYKVGDMHFDVFALGHDESGKWFGVSTEVVET